MGLFKYIKAAFTNRWNLLAFVGGMGFAALSGRADVVAPLVLAAEVGYLGLLGTHEKFRKYVDAQEHKRQRAAESGDAKGNLRRIMAALPRRSRDRYKELEKRCRELRSIAGDLHAASDVPSLHDLQLEGLDKLLWIYLKLLFTEFSLDRFLEATDEDRIEADIKRLQERIDRESSRPDTEQRVRILETLRDDLMTCESRLENYRKANANHELIEVQIRRLENKIHSLSELAINRKEPDFISDQVDAVASSMFETERTLNDLEFVTGIHSSADEPVPELLRREPLRARR